MLSSIHPLGERGRRNRWGITVASFAIGATMAGATVGGALGAAGSLFAGVEAGTIVALTGIAALSAGALDLARVAPPGPARQVNEHWIGHYRGWVYGGAFGAQLGAGFVTYVVTWTIYVTFLLEFLSGSVVWGAVIGAVFGLGRSSSLLVAGFVRRPSDLTRFHRAMARLGPPVRAATAVTVAAVGAAVMTGAVL